MTEPAKRNTFRWMTMGGIALTVAVLGVAMVGRGDPSRATPATTAMLVQTPPAPSDDDDPTASDVEATSDDPALDDTGLLDDDDQQAAAATAPTVAIPPAATPVERPVAAAAQGSGTIPDGVYNCRTWSGNMYIGLGKIRSVNNSLDTQLLAKVGATFTGATPSTEGITVLYTSARGYRESMDCARQ